MSHFTAPQMTADDALAAWWRAPRGGALINTEAELLKDALDNVFGWELLQIGAWGQGRELLQSARTRRATILATLEQQRSGAQADLVARGTQLPVASDSMDAVLLAHSLEFAADPYALVREADRVLTGEGQLLVLGFRRWSSWGLRAVASRGSFPPGMQRTLSERRLLDWLVLLGYEIEPARYYLYGSPWGGIDTPARALRRGLTNWLPAGAYLLKARKRLYTITPLRLRLREPDRVRVLGLARPSAPRSQPKSS